MIVILDKIRSLHNVGSIFRTCDGAGVEKLYLGGYTPTPLDRLGQVRQQVAKTALGAEEKVSYEKVEDTPDLIDKLKSHGVKVVAVEQTKDSIPYTALNLKNYPPENLALVFGHEVDGVSPEVLSRVNETIEIPMSGFKESLNVSVSAGIVLFYLRDCGKN